MGMAWHSLGLLAAMGETIEIESNPGEGISAA